MKTLCALVSVALVVGASGADDKTKPTDFETKYLKFIRDKETESAELKEKIKKTEAEYTQAEKEEGECYAKHGGVEKFRDRNYRMPEELVNAIKARKDKQDEVQKQYKTLGAISRDRATAIKELPNPTPPVERKPGVPSTSRHTVRSPRTDQPSRTARTG